jgi:hypothetical protein
MPARCSIQSDIRDDIGRYAAAKVNLSEADPYFCMVAEELDAFFDRVQKRYEESEPPRDPNDPDNSRILFSMRRALCMRFGVDVAKRVLRVPRKKTRWNAYQSDHYAAKSNEMKGADG